MIAKHAQSKHKGKNAKHYLSILFCIGLFIIAIFVSTAQAEEPEFLNVKLEQSTDQINWEPLDGILNAGFSLSLNTSIPYYYLDVKYAATNTPLEIGYHGFYVTSYPFGFFDYWDDRGVNEDALFGTWQAHMWTIINGSSPIFYIYVDANQDMSLIDGLLRDFGGDGTAKLRVNGDYYIGDYVYEGNISSADGNISHYVMNFEFNDHLEKFFSPNIINMDLKKSTNQSVWNSIQGTLHSLYSSPINSSMTYYWIDTEDVVADSTIATDFFGFYVDTYPSGYLAYWNSLGVNSGASAGTWQAHMWRIINGDAPRFYLHNDAQDGFTLVDGLYRDYSGYNIIMPYRINADITHGRYSFSGTVTTNNGLDSDPIEIVMYFIDESNYRIWVDDNYDVTTPGWGVDHFETINDGLNACPDGGIVYTQPGIYDEIVMINKPLILSSRWGAMSTTISDDGATYSELSQTNGYTVMINHSNVLLSNFTVERYASVIRTAAVGTNPLVHLSHVEIWNCRIESFYDCIRLHNVDYGATYSNKYDSQVGRTSLSLDNTSYFQLWDDEFDGYDTYGVQVQDGYHGIIKDLTFDYRRMIGVHLESCTSVMVRDNEISWVEEDGIYVNDSNAINVTMNTIMNGTNGIRLGDNTIASISDNSYGSEVDRHISRAVRIEDDSVYYSDLQVAIDNAIQNQDLYLHEGNYTENIILDKKLSLHGLYDNEETVIYGDNSTPAFLIANDFGVRNVLLEDLSIMGGYHCLKTGKYDNVGGLRVENCIIRDPLEGYAVYIDPHNFSDESQVREGVDLFTNPITFLFSTIDGGFYYQYWPYEVFSATVPTQLVLQYNIIDSVYFNGSVSIEIEDNIIQSLGMSYSSDITIKDNTFENSIEHEKRYGVYIWSINGTPSPHNIKIENNDFFEYRSISVPTGVSGKAILIAGAKDITINNNAIRASSDGIWLTENYINRDGVLCTGSIYDIMVDNNDFVLCQSGIRFTEDVNGTVIQRNVFDRNQEGIRIYKSGFHVIRTNTFINNYEGLRIDVGSSDNLIYNNFFDNSAINAQDRSVNTNQWNVSLQPGINILGGPYIGGNFWSDYSGSDTDGDSIGDTNVPYNGSGLIRYGGDYLPIILSDIEPPFIRVLSPNGGESLNDTVEITWISTDEFDNDIDIDIEYSNDSGVTWRIVAINEENDGSYQWDIASLPMGSEYLVRITATDNAGLSANDTSDNTFTIYRQYPRPQVNIINPKLGFWYFFDAPSARFLPENLFAIGPITIDVMVESPLAIEKVEFYVDDQLVYSLDTAFEGMYSWTWDERVLFYHEIKVVAYDEDDNLGESEIGITIFNFNLI